MESVLARYAKTEPHRHACEVRWLVAWRAERGLQAAIEYLAGVEEHRGAEAALRLRLDANAAWGQRRRAA